MLNIKFKLRKLQPDPSSIGRVFLVCYFNKAEFMFYTGLNASRAQWDDKKQEFRRNLDGYQKANMALDNLKNITKNYEKDCILAQKPLDAEVLKLLLRGKNEADKDKKTIAKWYDFFMEAKRMEGLKPASIRSHKATMEHFLEFHKKEAKSLTIDTYHDEAHQRFIHFLKSKKDYHPNYIGVIHKNLKTFFAFCAANGVKLSAKHARMKRIYIAPKREFLTQEELKKWMALDKPAWQMWIDGQRNNDEYFCSIPVWDVFERTKDIFTFQAMTGLRHSDLFRLTTDHVITLENGSKALRFYPQKTTSVKIKPKPVVVGLIPAALSILEKYATPKPSQAHVLLPVPHLRHYNRYIQYAAHAAGFTEPTEIIEYKDGVPVSTQKPRYQTLTSHVARHTFGTISRILGVDLADLKDLMGHSDVRTTSIYDHMANEYKAIKQMTAWGDSF